MGVSCHFWPLRRVFEGEKWQLTGMAGARTHTGGSAHRFAVGAEHLEAVMSNDIDRDQLAVRFPGGPRLEESLITVPLLARDELKGMLNLLRFGRDNGFVDADLDMEVRGRDRDGVTRIHGVANRGSSGGIPRRSHGRHGVVLP